MPSSNFPSMRKCFSKKHNFQIVLFIACFLLMSCILLFQWLQVFYIIKTLNIGQCFVKSVDSKMEKSDFYPAWFVTVTSNNQNNDDMIIGSRSYSTKHVAWDAAHEYQANETYRCYRWKSLTSISGLEWQWDKPTIHPNPGVSFFLAIIFLCVSITLLILKHIYQKEPRRNSIPLPAYNDVTETNFDH